MILSALGKLCCHREGQSSFPSGVARRLINLHVRISVDPLDPVHLSTESDVRTRSASCCVHSMPHAHVDTRCTLRMNSVQKYIQHPTSWGLSAAVTGLARGRCLEPARVLACSSVTKPSATNKRAVTYLQTTSCSSLSLSSYRAATRRPDRS